MCECADGLRAYAAGPAEHEHARCVHRRGIIFLLRARCMFAGMWEAEDGEEVRGREE